MGRRCTVRKRCDSRNCWADHVLHARSPRLGSENPDGEWCLVGGGRPYLNVRGRGDGALYSLNGVALRKLGLAIVRATNPRRRK